LTAFYYSKFREHNKIPNSEIIGALTIAYGKNHLDLKKQLTKSWEETIKIIKDLIDDLALKRIDISKWGILYEYWIPRRTKRIDIVILGNGLIFIIEVKYNSTCYNTADIAQLEDYCLDLRDFHSESRNQIIIPILLSTEAPTVLNDQLIKIDDCVQEVRFANAKNLSDVISKSICEFDFGKEYDLQNWNLSEYLPTPTIIEAAQSLYSGQSVTEISRNHAGAENLSATTTCVLNAIKEAQITNSKIICFITGVPGAGKTLAGLNIVHNREFQNDDNEIGVFLSGNGPLVKVLSEALSRDFSKRQDANKKEARRKVNTFIQNVHEYIDLYHGNAKIPIDKVLVYDEAQRAWTKEHKTKKSSGAITESEPEILLSIMNRSKDWSVIIALIGGGQEINTGEAGLREWGKTIEAKFSDWKVYISPQLIYGDHSTGNMKLFEIMPPNVEIFESNDLHLNVTIRSYKAKDLSEWVSLLLDGRVEESRRLFNENLIHYPIFITRDLNTVKIWLQKKARGTRRIGIVASSGGRRLRAYGYDPYYGLRGNSNQDELGAWFLNPSNDVRSSNFLEIIATEFAIQGLELDWTGLFWDADLRRTNDQWEFKQFRGTRWIRVGKTGESVENNQKMQFIINKYRVLLTRAREGLIIWVPKGDLNDQTRLPKFYDETFEYLVSCGIKIL